MGATKSLDNYIVIASLLRDVQSHTGVFKPRALRLTLAKVKNRLEREGISFLTKTLPRLAKAFDKALTGDTFDPVGWRKLPNSKLPRFLGELFERVFSHDGMVLQTPCVLCIQSIRQLLYLYYKYELPYDESVAGNCLDQFAKTDQEVSANAKINLSTKEVEKAQKLLARVFCNFDILDIVPRHGPGAVSGKEKRTEKFRFDNVPPRTTNVYPLDAYYYASLGHVVDRLDELTHTKLTEPSARVLLVPKDSRGPRIISCEPAALQWIQQGLMKAIVKLVESHPLTRNSIHFTDQQPNRLAALASSLTQENVTLDLKEASDRVSLSLVRLLWPEHLVSALEASRSLSTILPDGRSIVLNKFAPMGSALCFPVMACTIWALLVSAGCAEDSNVLVYGDDVIVSKEQSLNAISILERANLVVNRDKSCTSGFFRESCGMDAYKGIDVTPVRFRTVWSQRRAAGAYESWIAYCNSLYIRGYVSAAIYIAEELYRIYGSIPDNRREPCGFPAFVFYVPSTAKGQIRSRTNVALQRREELVYVSEPVRVHELMDGWKMLLRYFTEGASSSAPFASTYTQRWSTNLKHVCIDVPSRFQASSYTLRKRSLLRKRWR